MNPTEKQFMELGIEVHEQAESIFRDCGQLQDFCIQNTSALEFGGHNRILLRSRGWIASEWHCTNDFLTEFRKLPNTVVE